MGITAVTVEATVTSTRMYAHVQWPMGIPDIDPTTIAKTCLLKYQTLPQKASSKTCVHMHMNAITQMHTLTRTHVHTHTHTHRAHTHTHIHTQGTRIKRRLVDRKMRVEHSLSSCLAVDFQHLQVIGLHATKRES